MILKINKVYFFKYKKIIYISKKYSKNFEKIQINKFNGNNFRKILFSM